MNTLIIMLLTAIYIFFILFLVYLFRKNEYDLKKTLRYIKVKILSCCIKDKKKLIKKIGATEVKNIENELLNVEDCEAPLNFPLDLCVSSELEIEEVKIREKILRTLKERDNFIIDGGKQKLIVPLEATLFLTKSLSPLVTEDGSIQVISEHKKIERSELEEIRIYIKSLKDEKGELLYQDDNQIIDLIKRSITEDIKSKQSNSQNIDISKEIKKIKEKEESNKIVDSKSFDPSLLKNEDDLIFDNKEEIKRTQKEDSSLDNRESLLAEENYKSNTSDETSLDSLGSLLDEELSKVDENLEEPTLKSLGALLNEDSDESSTKKEEEEDSFIIEDNPFGDNEEIDFSEMEKEISAEVDSLDFGDIDEFEEEGTRENFYTKRKYISVKIKQIRKDNLKEDLESILDNDNVKKAILNNLIKTKPLIFNDNKEIVFIDQKNFIFALSKVYGMESTKVLKEFESYSMQDTITLSRIISVSMNKYISDLITGNKKVNRILLEKNKDLYFSFGLFLMTESFLDVLSQDEYDLFRAMPYNTEYKISNSSEKTKTALVPSFQEVEI